MDRGSRHPAGDEFLPTRNSLLSRLRNWDDQEGWREFFDTYWKFLYCIAIKAGLSDDDARDVVQETVVAVAKALREGRFRATEGGSFKAWLKLIVQRRVSNHLRKRKLPLAELAPPADDTSPADLVETIPAPGVEVVGEVWDEEWAKNLADVAIERVKQKVGARRFQMFDLYVLKNWPVRAVAKTLHTSVALVYLDKSSLKLGLDVHLEFIMAVVQRDHAAPQASWSSSRITYGLENLASEHQLRR